MTEQPEVDSHGKPLFDPETGLNRFGYTREESAKIESNVLHSNEYEAERAELRLGQTTEQLILRANAQKNGHAEKRTTNIIEASKPKPKGKGKK